MTRLDPRAQLAWLLVVVLGALLGDVGLAGAAALGAATIGLERAVGRWLRVLAPLLPLAGLVVLFDLLGGQGGAGGVRLAARLLVLATVGFAFAQAADGERLIAGLRALHVPYAVVFVLVAGGRFVPATVADLANLRDAARLRGVRLDGSPWRQFAGWQRLLVPLLVTTVRRGLQTGEAMEARAFGSSRQRTQRVGLAWRRRDTLALVAAAGYLIGTAVAR